MYNNEVFTRKLIQEISDFKNKNNPDNIKEKLSDIVFGCVQYEVFEGEKTSIIHSKINNKFLCRLAPEHMQIFNSLIQEKNDICDKGCRTPENRAISGAVRNYFDAARPDK